MSDKEQMPMPDKGGPQLPKIPAMGGKTKKEKRGLWAILLFIVLVLAVLYWLEQFGLIDITSWFS